MERSVSAAVTILAVVAMSSAKGDARPREEPAHMVGTADRLSLTAEERSVLERVAVDGSARAALRLRQFYSTRPNGDHQRDIEYWARVEVDNGGGPAAEGTLGSALVIRAMRDGSQLEHRRGCYFLRRAAAAGLDGADDLIGEYRCPTPEKAPDWVGFKGGGDK